MKLDVAGLAADRVFYRAKRKGRNRVSVAKWMAD